MIFIDSHAHLTGGDLRTLEDELERAKIAHIQAIINICTDSLSLKEVSCLPKEKRLPLSLLPAQQPRTMLLKMAMLSFPELKSVPKKICFKQ